MGYVPPQRHLCLLARQPRRMRLRQRRVPSCLSWWKSQEEWRPTNRWDQNFRLDRTCWLLWQFAARGDFRWHSVCGKLLHNPQLQFRCAVPKQQWTSVPGFRRRIPHVLREHHKGESVSEITLESVSHFLASSVPCPGPCQTPKADWVDFWLDFDRNVWNQRKSLRLLLDHQTRRTHIYLIVGLEH